MGWPKLLVLVRHAESLGNVHSAIERTKLEMSTHDYPLTTIGNLQAEATGKYIRARYGEFDTRYVSYYRRSRETMELIYPGAKLYEDPRLAEGQRGIWHTHTPEQINCIFPGESMRKEREGLYHYRPLGGENWPDIELRIHSFLSTLARDSSGEKVIIVVHGHWLILFERLIQHFSIDEAMRRYKEATVRNASVTVYRGQDIDGKPRLVRSEEECCTPWLEAGSFDLP